MRTFELRLQLICPQLQRFSVQSRQHITGSDCTSRLSDPIQPAVDTAREHGGGLFVLARTSNPDAGTFQHAVLGDRSVAQAVVGTVGAWNAADDGATDGWVATGSFGVVVGATLPEMDVDLDGLGGPILAPGLGG